MSLPLSRLDYACDPAEPRIGKPRSYLTEARRAALVKEYGWAPDEVEWWLDRGDASEAWLAERREYLGRDGL